MKKTVFLIGLLSVVCFAFGAGSSLPAGYTIPVVDLAGQVERQVIVDREAGQYLGHPTTVLLEDNKTIIIVYPKGHGRGGIVMKRSADSGLTWSERLAVPASWATSKEVPTIHRVIDKAGTKRLIMFSGLYPIRMSVSEDNGATWSELEPIGDFGGIVTMGCVVRVGDGEYMALFHDDGRFFKGEGKRTKFQVFKTVSTDGGLTWGKPVVIAEHAEAHLCEPGVVRSPDGKQLAMLLRENSRKFNSFVCFSDDEGKTWSTPRELTASLTGDRHTGRYGPGGRLFITFRDTTRESVTQGDWVGWVGTYADIAEGREGQYRVRLMDNRHQWDCAYPGLELLPDGTFVTTTYGHWSEGESPYIVSVRFKLDEIDAEAGKQHMRTKLFVSGEGGYHTYRIPAIIVSKAGTLLAFCEGRKGGRSDTGNIDILVKRSEDGGETWSEQQVVWDDAGNTCGNPCPVVDEATGKIWLTMTWNRGDDHEGLIIDGKSKDTRRVYLACSADDGKTWSEPKDITKDVKDPGWTWYATGPCTGIQLEKGENKGRLVIPCDHIEAGTKKYYSHVIYSDDHGTTWRLGGSTPTDEVNECQVAELADGRLMLNMRNYYRVKKNRAVSVSSDGGMTWGEIYRDASLPEPRCQASFVRYSLASEGGKDRLLFSNPAHQDSRVNMTVRVSYDEGKTWGVSKTLHSGPAAYSCLAVLPDGDIACFYEAGEKGAYEAIVFERFSLGWLTGGKDL